MATPTYIAPIDGMRGKLNKKDKTVFRQKHARDANGAIIADMKPEAYVVQHPRDWKKKPAKGAEKAKQDRWAEACARTKAILDDPQQRTQWEERWKAQLKKGEEDAPIDPRTKKRKIYIKFDCYVRSKVWRGQDLT
ncbi:MAG: hypothetical protein J6R26_04120 [Paludibacteraceae bacterium]|nr:hypothetical protein [Paludibacteraceae bacterium]